MVSSPSSLQLDPTTSAHLRFDHPAVQDAVAQAESCRRKEFSPHALLEACIDRIEQTDLFVQAVAERRYNVVLDEIQQGTLPIAPSTSALWGVPFPIAEAWLPPGFPFATASTQDILALFPPNHPIRMLCKAGAIPLVSTRTSTHPTSLARRWATAHDVAHPNHPNRWAGAGYSGDAALIGAGALTFSVGVETSAEVRYPAHQCGIFGHNLSVDAPSASQRDTLASPRISLLTRSARDLKALSSLLFKKEQQAKEARPVAWKDVTVWLCEDFGIPGWPTSTDHRQKLRQVGRMLSGYGAYVHKWDTRRLRSALSLSAHLLSNNDEDSTHSFTQDHFLWHCLPNRSQRWLRRLMAPLASPHTSTKRDLRLLQKELGLCLEGTSLLVAPTFPDTAVLKKNWLVPPNPWLFAGLFRLLGWDCTTLPVGVQSDGLPLGLQLVSSPQQEELRLQAVERLAQDMGGWRPPSLLDL